jgi:sulfide:quinone oxidoreductase
MQRILILGAGFGGMELCALLSEGIPGEADITLIDQAEGFAFGYSKLDIMFRGADPESVVLPYADFAPPGVRLVRDTITAIDPAAKRVTTVHGSYEADILVIALGAEYDYAATDMTTDDEFYSFEGAAKARDRIAAFRAGRAVLGVCGAPFKCPPAPSECVLMLHDHLQRAGVRDACEITLVMPFPTPVPPSPDTSAALVEAFAERDIRFVPSVRVSGLDRERGAVLFDDGGELPYDLFLGVPRQRAPEAVRATGLTVDGYLPVDPHTLATSVPGVYAIGDVATQGTPKAGVFSEGAARGLAPTLIAQVRGSGEPGHHAGTGSCYIEFGADRLARVDVDFLSGPKPTGRFVAPSAELRAQKEQFGIERRARWFGRTA